MNNEATKVNVLQFKVYNQNFGTQKINVFSEEQEKHTGLIVIEDEKNILENKNADIALMQMWFSSRKFLYCGFYVDGKKVMYAQYFSPNQCQSNLIDISAKFSVFENTKIELEVPSDENATLAMYPSKTAEKGYKRQLIDFTNTDCDFCVILENKHNFPLKINILDEKHYPEGWNDENYKLELAICNNNFLQGGTINSSFLRIISENNQQTLMPIIFRNEIIPTTAFFSPYQCHDKMVDISFPFSFVKGNEKFGKFEVELLPYSKIMYMFFNKEANVCTAPIYRVITEKE